MIDYEKFIAKKIKNLPYSGIRKFFDIASEMKGVISLGVGEPDFYTPWNIRESGIYNIEKGVTSYTANAGILKLREEISKYLSESYNVNYDAQNQIIVTVGASEGIDVALRCMLEDGDEVIYNEPCFVSYKSCIEMAGGVAVAIPTKEENEFRLTPEDLLSKITDKTKVLLMSYPSNPTGAIMEREDLEKIAKIIIEHDLIVISDEIYSELNYTDSRHVSVAEIDGLYERTVLLNGFSKAFSMTGWRLGYLAGPPVLIEQMLKIHQYIIMCAPTTSQYAGIEALKNSHDSVLRMRDEYNARRNVMLNGFRSIGLDVFEPLGAFYIFPSIKSTGLSSAEFCEKLLYNQKVAVVPGDAFGESGEGFVRCSYAASMENLKKALDGINEFVTSLK